MLGLCFGSFVSALVWRLDKQAKGYKTKAKDQKPINHRNTYSIWTGRSMCSDCGHKLSVADLIPLFSWLFLKGRCRYCRKKIKDSPLVEIITAILFVGSYILWPYGFDNEGLFLFIVWLPTLVLLTALFVYDLRHMMLPDKLTFTIFGLTLVQLTGQFVLSGGELGLLWGALLGVVCLAGLFYLLFHISNGRWIGGGDVKLGLGLGVLAGSLPSSLLLLFLASAIGTLASMVMILTNKASKKSQVPFGPFLVTAAIIVQLFGPAIIDWYQRQFLFV